MPRVKIPEPTVTLENESGDRVRCPISGIQSWDKKGYHPITELQDDETETPRSINWSRFTVVQLRKIAKDAGVKSHSNRSKSELIEAIIKSGYKMMFEVVE